MLPAAGSLPDLELELLLIRRYREALWLVQQVVPRPPPGAGSAAGAGAGAGSAAGAGAGAGLPPVLELVQDSAAGAGAGALAVGAGAGAGSARWLAGYHPPGAGPPGGRRIHRGWHFRHLLHLGVCHLNPSREGFSQALNLARVKVKTPGLTD